MQQKGNTLVSIKLLLYIHPPIYLIFTEYLLHVRHLIFGIEINVMSFRSLSLVGGKMYAYRGAYRQPGGTTHYCRSTFRMPPFPLETSKRILELNSRTI